MNVYRSAKITMSLRAPALAASFLYLTVLGACSPPPEPVEIEQAPIMAVGHGAILGPGGQPIDLTEELIESAQRYYIASLERELEEDEESARTREMITSLVEDGILANALLVDWMLERAEPDNLAHLASVNSALRWHYVSNIQDDPVPAEGGKWSKGIDPDVARELELGGITSFLTVKTSGRKYVKECRDAGVPVPEWLPPKLPPEQVAKKQWELLGEIENEFLSTALKAELWRYTSKPPEPKGICLALPRYPPSSDKAKLFGVICLGTQTSKACFFDNPYKFNQYGRPIPEEFARTEEVSINRFESGAGLYGKPGGICTDCHAGENPFVVHPDKPPFKKLGTVMPPSWYDPLVHAKWPQNPGPTNLLDAVASTGRCDSCHRAGLFGGRFPDVSARLRGYCGRVLENAFTKEIIRTSPPSPPDPSKRTMPPLSTRESYNSQCVAAGNPKTCCTGRKKGTCYERERPFAKHTDALVRACKAPPSIGVVVKSDVPEDQSFVSPPMVIGPLYQCATKVAVRGAILDAKVSLFVKKASAAAAAPTSLIGTVVARNPDHVEFNVPALEENDVVTARQEKDGQRSDPSPEVHVRDYSKVFGKLPAPEIDPTTIHKCAGLIAVRHVPGATVTVFSNGGNPRTASTSTGWTVFRPGKNPFDVGDSFTARASLCQDRSDESAAEKAVAEPATIPAPTLKPKDVFAGQELVSFEDLVHGARVDVAEARLGPIGNFSTPITSHPNWDLKRRIGRPLGSGEKLLGLQQLCSPGPRFETPPAQPCEEMPPPRIRHPLVGDTFVVVEESIPGARIRIYDAANKELGDGAGTVVLLRRAVTGRDVLTVVQQVGECNSRTAYRVSVRNAGP